MRLQMAEMGAKLSPPNRLEPELVPSDAASADTTPDAEGPRYKRACSGPS